MPLLLAEPLLSTSLTGQTEKYNRLTILKILIILQYYVTKPYHSNLTQFVPLPYQVLPHFSSDRVSILPYPLTWTDTPVNKFPVGLFNNSK